MIGIIDYGAGNTQSVKNALEKLQLPYYLSDSIEKLGLADRLILPGVGHAETAMQALQKRNLIEFVSQYTKPLLGICLGMQLLGSFSDEGNTKCLGIIPEKTVRFESLHMKVPHIGWNTVEPRESVLFLSIQPGSYFYFVHSYFMPKNPTTIAQTTYDIQFSAAIQHKNFYGVQFHPEKSGAAGLQLLQNFSKI